MPTATVMACQRTRGVLSIRHGHQADGPPHAALGQHPLHLAGHVRFAQGRQEGCTQGQERASAEIRVTPGPAAQARTLAGAFGTTESQALA